MTAMQIGSRILGSDSSSEGSSPSSGSESHVRGTSSSRRPLSISDRDGKVIKGGHLSCVFQCFLKDTERESANKNEQWEPGLRVPYFASSLPSVWFCTLGHGREGRGVWPLPSGRRWEKKKAFDSLFPFSFR